MNFSSLAPPSSGGPILGSFLSTRSEDLQHRSYVETKPIFENQTIPPLLCSAFVAGNPLYQRNSQDRTLQLRSTTVTAQPGHLQLYCWQVVKKLGPCRTLLLGPWRCAIKDDVFVNRSNGRHVSPNTKTWSPCTEANTCRDEWKKVCAATGTALFFVIQSVERND